MKDQAKSLGEEFKNKHILGRSHCGAVEINPTNIHEDAGLIPAFPTWVRDIVLL